MTTPDWCIINENGQIVCQRCGDTLCLPRVCTETTYRKWLEWFGQRHQGCVERNER